METSSTPQRQSRIRSPLSLIRVVLWAGLVAVALFVPVDWNGCRFYRYGVREFLHFAYVFAWLLIFFRLRMRWRLLLLCFTLPLVVISFGLHGVPEENAGPEAAAVHDLKQIRSSLEDYRHEHKEEGYPESWKPTTPLSEASRFYRFVYVPSRDASGKIVSYVIQAMPIRHECDFYVSFTMADDGKVFYTHENRAATTTDRSLDQ